MKPIEIEFPEHSSEYGVLNIIEGSRDIPFSIQRVYYITGVPTDMRRGFHAHKTLQQVLVCVHGSCEVLLDDGKEKTTVLLNSPQKGLLVQGCIWREMYHFTEGAVLLVLASDFYNEEDYIRNYDDFINFLKKEGTIV